MPHTSILHRVEELHQSDLQALLSLDPGQLLEGIFQLDRQGVYGQRLDVILLMADILQLRQLKGEQASLSVSSPMFPGSSTISASHPAFGPIFGLSEQHDQHP